MPGFNINGWTRRELSSGLPSGGAGVGFFVTTVSLNLPRNTDTQLSLQFDTMDQPYRALLFVNGWKFGKVRPTTVMVRIPDDVDTARGKRWPAV